MGRLIALGAGLLAVVLAGAGVGGAAPSFGETGPEFVDLPYLEESSGTSTLGECDAPEPGVLVCGLTYEGELVSTLIGHATEILHGTTLLRTGESCVLSTGATGAPVLADLSDGTMFTADGSEIYFRATFEGCTSGAPPAGTIEAIGFWDIDGGTGRFEDASGLLSTILSEGVTRSAGTIRVRKDRWEEILPAPRSYVITPGVAGVQEGNEGQVVVEVPVTLSLPSSEPVTVDWATLDNGDPGVATADVDYVAASGTVTFAPGETTKTVSVTVNGDTEVEPPLLYGEWGLVQFSNPSPNATIDTAFDGVGVFIIVDDD